jgi:hypothetical protein
MHATPLCAARGAGRCRGKSNESATPASTCSAFRHSESYLSPGAAWRVQLKVQLLWDAWSWALKEKAHYLATRIGPAWLGIRSRCTPAGPCVAGSV